MGLRRPPKRAISGYVALRVNSTEPFFQTQENAMEVTTKPNPPYQPGNVASNALAGNNANDGASRR